jgi:hypothetical protein
LDVVQKKHFLAAPGQLVDGLHQIDAVNHAVQVGIRPAEFDSWFPGFLVEFESLVQ